MTEQTEQLVIQAKFNIEVGDMAKGIPILEVPQVKQEVDNYLYSDEAKRFIILIDQHTKSEVRQVLDRLEKKQRTYEVVTRNTLPGYDSFTKKVLIPVEGIAAERKLYE